MTTATLDKPLDWSKPQEVSYAIPLWLRDLQIKANIGNVRGRIAQGEIRTDPIAVVCYGPSLNQTWGAIKDFKYTITCSGAHKFLIDRGMVPTWHVDVDPRIHKLQLIGEPNRDVEYLLASTCHPDYVKKMVDDGYNVKLWHVFDQTEEALRVLPEGEWALTGGCSVGLRAIALARFLGFRSIDVFGMDGCDGPSGKHAADHPNQAKLSQPTEYNGKTYYTTPGFLEAARQTPHEMDQLPDVTARFHGKGLVQAMMADYTRKPESPTETLIAFNKPELISESYRQQNAQLHRENLAYGVGAGKHAGTIKKLFATLKTQDGLPASVLDYGCGKSFLQKELPFPIYEYDPAIAGKEESPRPADLVCCLDVLEHIEPDKLMFVLGDLRRVTRQIGYFVINTGPAKKVLPDGRNTHLIQQGQAWWTEQLSRYFTIGKVFPVGPEIHVLVGPLKKPKKSAIGSMMKVTRPSVELNLDRLEWRTEPYPIACASNVLDPQVYRQLAESFPPVEAAKAFGGGKKWSLSQVNNQEQYHAFLNRTPIWKSFYDWVKSPAFLQRIQSALEAQGIDVLKHKNNLTTRFEFSFLPADGGSILPHTDIPSKLITLVVSMLPNASEWDQAWGGGTDVLKPKDGQPALQDYKADPACFNVVHSYPYQPNQCVLFVKTEDSWHQVGSMTGAGSSTIRKTLTINIERGL